MDAAEIVMHEVNCSHVFVILNFPAESVGEASKAPHRVMAPITKQRTAGRSLCIVNLSFHA
jgi:hypothetical protein